MAKKKKGIPENETKRAKFIRLVEPRVAKAAKSIDLIGNCFGNEYEYSDKDVDKIKVELSDAFSKLIARMESGGKAATTFKL